MEQWHTGGQRKVEVVFLYILFLWTALNGELRCMSRCIYPESARAVSGRRCPHSGKGEDFLTGQLNFFTETAVTLERKVDKLFSRSEINRHAEG